MNCVAQVKFIFLSRSPSPPSRGVRFRRQSLCFSLILCVPGLNMNFMRQPQWLWLHLQKCNLMTQYNKTKQVKIKQTHTHKKAWALISKLKRFAWHMLLLRVNYYSVRLIALRIFPTWMRARCVHSRHFNKFRCSMFKSDNQTLQSQFSIDFDAMQWHYVRSICELKRK